MVIEIGRQDKNVFNLLVGWCRVRNMHLAQRAQIQRAKDPSHLPYTFLQSNEK